MPLGIAVSCRGVSKSFALLEGGNAWKLVFGQRRNVPSFTALDDVTFEVPKGQFVGILGRNGAGKSTLLRVAGGIYPADSGRIQVHGALSGVYELGIAGNPQLTGRQYADRLLKIHAFSAEQRREMIDDIHEFTELGDRFEDPVLTYSAGMGARLFFAVATAGQYSVYLLDEVLAVGDMHFQSKCWRRLRDRISAGASGVLVTHDWASIVKLCETAYVLDHGQVKFFGAAERAARFYLYGDAEQEPIEEGVARFIGQPEYTARIERGEDFQLSAQAEILKDADVAVTLAVERLQPGFGWETSILSRNAVPVGSSPGRFRVAADIPSVPLEPGSYQISLHLGIPDPELPNRRIPVAGFGWLSGTGLPLEVTGSPRQGLALPAQWSLEPA